MTDDAVMLGISDFTPGLIRHFLGCRVCPCLELRCRVCGFCLVVRIF